MGLVLLVRMHGLESGRSGQSSSSAHLTVRPNRECNAVICLLPALMESQENGAVLPPRDLTMVLLRQNLKLFF